MNNLNHSHLANNCFPIPKLRLIFCLLIRDLRANGSVHNCYASFSVAHIVRCHTHFHFCFFYSFLCSRCDEKVIHSHQKLLSKTRPKCLCSRRCRPKTKLYQFGVPACCAVVSKVYSAFYRNSICVASAIINSVNSSIEGGNGNHWQINNYITNY